MFKSSNFVSFAYKIKQKILISKGTELSTKIPSAAMSFLKAEKTIAITKFMERKKETKYKGDRLLSEWFLSNYLGKNGHNQ